MSRASHCPINASLRPDSKLENYPNRKDTSDFSIGCGQRATWKTVCQKWSKLVAGANVTMYVGATFKVAERGRREAIS